MIKCALDLVVGQMSNCPNVKMTPQNAQSFGCFSNECIWLYKDDLLPEIDHHYSLYTIRPAGCFTGQKWLETGKIMSGLGDHQCSVMSSESSLEKTVFFNFGTSSQCSILTDKEITITQPSLERRYFHPSVGWLVCAASMNGGNVISHFVNLFNLSYRYLYQIDLGVILTSSVTLKNLQIQSNSVHVNYLLKEEDQNRKE